MACFAAHPLLRVEALEGVRAVLEPAVGFPACAPHLPPGTVGCAIRHSEIDLGMALAGSMTEDQPGVARAGAVPVPAVAADLAARWGRAQARDLGEQSEAKGIEQGRLAGASGPGDREYSRGGEWFGLEIDGKVASETGKVAAPDGQNAHQSSPP
jgi:hypothetical protein